MAPNPFHPSSLWGVLCADAPYLFLHHQACIFEWLRIRAACPTCRLPLLNRGGGGEAVQEGGGAVVGEVEMEAEAGRMEASQEEEVQAGGATTPWAGEAQVGGEAEAWGGDSRGV